MSELTAEDRSILVPLIESCVTTVRKADDREATAASFAALVGAAFERGHIRVASIGQQNHFVRTLSERDRYAIERLIGTCEVAVRNWDGNVQLPLHRRSYAAAFADLLSLVIQQGQARYRTSPSFAFPPVDLSTLLPTHVTVSEAMVAYAHQVLEAKRRSDIVLSARLVADIRDACGGEICWFAMNADESAYCVDFDSEREGKRWFDDQKRERPEWIEANGYHLVKRVTYTHLQKLALAAAAQLDPTTTISASDFNEPIPEL